MQVPTAFDELLGDLVLPPALTTVRVNTTKCSREEVVTSLDHILSSVSPIMISQVC